MLVEAASEPQLSPRLTVRPESAEVPFGWQGGNRRSFMAARMSTVQLRLHGNRRTGRSTGLQVHRCWRATLDMTASTCMPQPLQVVPPAAAATGGTTHVVLLKLALNYWLTMYYNIPPWVLSVVGNRPQSQLVDALRPAGGAFR